MEFGAELQEILYRIMQRIMRIITSALALSCYLCTAVLTTVKVKVMAYTVLAYSY